jgi:hypothetical protein
MKGKLSYLTFSFVLLFFLYPYLEEGIGGIILSFLVTATFFFGIYAVAHDRRNFVIALSLGVRRLVGMYISQSKAE